MTDRQLFCFGYGYVAAALGALLRRKGWHIAGTTTSAEKAASMTRSGVSTHLWRDTGFDTGWLDNTNAILISTPPGEDGCPSLAAAQEDIAAHAKQIQWIGYLSTNGVYGDHDGAWVSEESELRPSSDRARRRVQAEKAWAAFARTHQLPLIVFRLPGIYGPGRSALDSVRQGRAKRVLKPGQVFSRMHVNDIAAALIASMEKPFQYSLFNLADDEPAPPQDVIEYACMLLGVAPPPLVSLDDASMSDMAKSFYADNKRVLNKRMKDALGVTLAYPTYREGLNAIFAAENNTKER